MTDQRKGGIAWTEETWNPVKGCSRVSEGCRNCYAELQAGRMATGAYKGLVRLTDAGPRWTGTVRLDERTLRQAIYWERPRTIFVNSMSDLFHENLGSQSIARVFAAMALAPQHRFQVLTKRADRMLSWFQGGYMPGMVQDQVRLLYDGFPKTRGVLARSLEVGLNGIKEWPLPHVWMGVSVENQETAENRVPRLLQVPAAVRFVSYEPALGPVDFERLRVPLTGQSHMTISALHRTDSLNLGQSQERVDWVIVGGESGPGARPFDLAWARSIVAQCRAAGVAVFVKQLGAAPWAGAFTDPGGSSRVNLDDRKGADPAEWPEDIRVREMPS